FLVPREIPNHVSIVHDEAQAQSDNVSIGTNIPGAIQGAISSNVLDAMQPVAPPPPKPVAQKLRVSSGVAEGMLIRQVRPQYPTAARMARVEGRGVLRAVIGKDGAVQDLRVISGHPLLVGAAIDAAAQWHYKPYYLNQEPVEVETQIV